MCPPQSRLWSDWEGSWSPSAEGTPGVTRESWQWSHWCQCVRHDVTLLALTISLYIYIYLYSILYRFAARTKCSRRCAENGMESYSASCCMNVHAIASGQDKIRQRKAESKRSNPSVWERVTLTPKATVMFWDSLHSEYVKSGVDHLARALREEDFSWLSGYSFKRSSHKCRGRSTNN